MIITDCIMEFSLIDMMFTSNALIYQIYKLTQYIIIGLLPFNHYFQLIKVHNYL